MLAPPQKHNEVISLVINLDTFISDGAAFDADPVIKMAVVHHQFESLHSRHQMMSRLTATIEAHVCRPRLSVVVLIPPTQASPTHITERAGVVLQIPVASAHRVAAPEPVHPAV